MANFRDTITTVFAIDKNAVTSGLKQLVDDYRNAEGFSNKFKVAAGGAMEFVKGHALSLAAVGGAALVGFAVKASQAFQDTAKGALDLAKATGVSTEAASRAIAVADDYQVSAGTLTKALTEVVKGLDADKWDKWGVSVRDAGGELKSADDIMFDGLARLSQITNGTEQAAAGNDLFGKSYKTLAPLIGHTREEYDKMLGSVEKGQVITDAESAKAEKMRLAQDELSDAVGELTLSIGGLVAEGAPLLTFLADAALGLETLIEKAKESGSAWLKIKDTLFGRPDDGGQFEQLNADAKEAATNAAGLAAESARLTGQVDRYRQASVEAAEATADQAVQTAHLAEQLRLTKQAAAYAADAERILDEKQARVAASARAAAQAAHYLAGEVDDAALAADAMTTAYATLMGHIDQRDAWRNATDAVAAWWTAITEKAPAGEVEENLDNVKRAYGQLIEGMDDVPDEVKTKIITELDKAEQEDMQGLLAQIQYLEEHPTTNAAVLVAIRDGDIAKAERLVKLLERIEKASTGGRGGVGERLPSPDGFGAREQTAQTAGGARTDAAGGRGTTRGFTTSGAPGSQQELADAIASGEAGVWEAAAEAVDGSVVDQKASMDDLMAARLEQNDITLAAYLAYLDAENAAEIAAGNRFEERQRRLYNLSRQIRDDQAADAQQAADDAAQAAQDQIDAEDRKYKWLYENQQISAEQYKAYLQGRYGSDAAYTEGWYALQDGVKQVNADVAEAAKQAADAAAQAVSDAEEAKRAEYEKTVKAYEDSIARIFALQKAGADLALAIQEQAYAKAQLELVQQAAANGDQAAIDALGQFTQNAAKETFEGAQAQAAAQGLQPGTPEYAKFIQDQIAAYLQGGGASLGDQFAAALKALAAALPAAGQFPTGPPQPFVVQLTMDGRVMAEVLADPITGIQQRRADGAR